MNICIDECINVSCKHMVRLPVCASCPAKEWEEYVDPQTGWVTDREQCPQSLELTLFPQFMTVRTAPATSFLNGAFVRKGVVVESRNKPSSLGSSCGLRENVSAGSVHCLLNVLETGFDAGVKA